MAAEGEKAGKAENKGQDLGVIFLDLSRSTNPVAAVVNVANM